MKMKKYGSWFSIPAAFSALCCAGSPLALGFLAAAGLGFLINDFILFPALFLSLGVMYFSLNHNKKKHMNARPLYLTEFSAVIIMAGIFFRPVIWLGMVGLFVASVWDFILIRKNSSNEEI